MSNQTAVDIVSSPSPPFPAGNSTNRSDQYVSYVITGTLTIGINLIFLLIVKLNWSVARKWPLVIGMLVANIGSGTHNFFYGVYRLVLLRNGTIDQPYSAWKCMYMMIPTISIIGGVLPSTFQLLIGLERTAAVAFYLWYSTRWTCKKTWIVTVCALTVVSLAWVIPAWYQTFSRHDTVTRECSTPRVIPYLGGISNLVFVTVVNTIGVAFTVVAMVIGKAQLSRSVSALGDSAPNYKRQVRLTVLLTAVALSDLILVILPNICMILNLVGIPALTAITYYSSALQSVYYAGNMFLYVCSNGDFRKIIVSSLKKLRCSNVSADSSRQSSLGSNRENENANVL